MSSSQDPELLNLKSGPGRRVGALPCPAQGYSIFHVAFWNCYIGHLLWAQHYAKHCPLRVYLILHTTLQILIIPVWMMRKMKLGKMEQGCKKQISSKPAALRTSALLCYLCLPSLQQRTCNSTCSREKKERIWRFPLNLVLAPFIYLFSYQFFQ